MKLMVDTSGVQFTAGRPFAPKTDQNDAQRTEKDTGRPLSVVQRPGGELGVEMLRRQARHQRKHAARDKRPGSRGRERGGS